MLSGERFDVQSFSTEDLVTLVCATGDRSNARDTSRAVERCSRAPPMGAVGPSGRSVGVPESARSPFEKLPVTKVLGYAHEPVDKQFRVVRGAGWVIRLGGAIKSEISGLGGIRVRSVAERPPRWQKIKRFE